jgi:hypothetical protein
MAEAADQDLIFSKRKAISALSMSVVSLEGDRQLRLGNAILRAIRALRETWPMWAVVRPYTAALFRGPNSPSMDSVIVLLSPYTGWNDRLHDKNDVIRWAAAASAVPYTEEVGQLVVATLTQVMDCNSRLRPHVPIEILPWSKMLSTPPHLKGHLPITDRIVRHIRGLEDAEVFKSYLLLAWSEYSPTSGIAEMEDSVREDFSGIGMWGHRKDLIQRLDWVIRAVDRQPSNPY